RSRGGDGGGDGAGGGRRASSARDGEADADSAGLLGAGRVDAGVGAADLPRVPAPARPAADGYRAAKRERRGPGARTMRAAARAAGGVHVGVPGSLSADGRGAWRGRGIPAEAVHSALAAVGYPKGACAGLRVAQLSLGSARTRAFISRFTCGSLILT